MDFLNAYQTNISPYVDCEPFIFAQYKCTVSLYLHETCGCVPMVTAGCSCCGIAVQRPQVNSITEIIVSHRVLDRWLKSFIILFDNTHIF